MNSSNFLWGTANERQWQTAVINYLNFCTFLLLCVETDGLADAITVGERLGLLEFLSLGTKLGSIAVGVGPCMGTDDGPLLGEMVGANEGSLGSSTHIVDGTGLT